ncbi:TIGR03067 domain-containing protein [uncultured Paludibaculum sp.]|uniref:TIGR03067 domain-containing protein n=1 Tax=uncultured Paludibaculum sp. TaxID=1765020 RepID=UPI002AAAD9C0|nr:TIGR03067 domain-containing protein [uncultured Paludibaculum sp.]
MRGSLTQLQGSWTIASLELDGQTMPATAHAGARIQISGARFTSTGMGAVYEGTVELHDPAPPTTHGWIDMKFDNGPEAGNTNFGIFDLDGDTWRLCLATRGSVRPTAFTSTPGSGVAVETLVRDGPKAQKRPGRSKPRQPKEAAAKPDPLTAALQGAWTMVSGVVDGIPMDESVVRWVRRVTKGNQTTISAGPQVLMEFEFTCDPSTVPMTIDYRHTAGPSSGKSQLGIYEFEGALLRIHTAAAGAPRPRDYTLVPGAKGSLTTWKRA